MRQLPPISRFIASLRRDTRGAVLIEAAFSISILVALLGGIVSYSLYFMAAHSLQSVANDSARASLAGLNAEERAEIVAQSVANGLANASFVEPDKVTVTTTVSGTYQTVRLAYDASNNVIFNATLLPMPDKTIARSATVQLASY